MRTRIQFLFFLTFLLTSCSVARLYTDDNVHRYPPTYFEQIEVYPSDQIGKSYSVIGEVISSVESLADGQISLKYLKKEAAKLGADGIINLRLEIESGMLATGTTAKGVAVRYTN